MIRLVAHGDDFVSEADVQALQWLDDNLKKTFAVKTLRVIKAFFGVTFDIRPEPDSGTVFLSTVGAGIRNIARRAT